MCSANNLIAPISGDSVALFYLEYQINHTSSTPGTRGGSGTWYETYVPQNKNMCINVNSELLSFDMHPSALVLKESSNREKDWHLALTLAFNGPPELPPNLLGLNEELDCAVQYVYKNTFSRDVEVECNLFGTNFSSVRIQEYSWKKGDSLSLKGKETSGLIELLW